MLSVMGANDDIHIAITKPFGAFVEDYYYHKIGGYSIVAQAMDDNQTWNSLMCMWDCLGVWMTPMF